MASEVAVWNIASNLCSACLDGRYENCYCDDDEKLKCDASCESSDDGCGSDIEDNKIARHRLKNKRHSIQDEYISDDEFQNNDEDDRPLPPSTTDWNSINSVLETGFNDYGGGEAEEEEGAGLTKRLSHNVNMQMVFVESEVESDKASDPDVEVYYDDNFEEQRPAHSGSFGELSYTGGRDIDSRDSGYVTTDVMDVAIERVTEVKKRRRSCTETVEESTRVLASLKLHEEHEERVQNELLEQKKKESEFIDDIHQKNVDELRTMKEYLQVHIARINVELLEQLEMRDYLYSHHEALLMDADDIAKANERNKIMTSPPPSAPATANQKAVNPNTNNSKNNKNSKIRNDDNTDSNNDVNYKNDTNNNDLQNANKIRTDNDSDNSNTESPSKSAKRRSFWWR